MSWNDWDRRLWLDYFRVERESKDFLRVSFYLLELTQFCKAHAWRRVINGGTYEEEDDLSPRSGADGFEAYVWGDT